MYMTILYKALQAGPIPSPKSLLRATPPRSLKQHKQNGICFMCCIGTLPNHSKFNMDDCEAASANTKEPGILKCSTFHVAQTPLLSQFLRLYLP